MKSQFSILLLALSLTTLAGDFYKVESMSSKTFYYKNNDVVYCMGTEVEHTEIVKGCVNLNSLKESKVSVNSAGKVVLENSQRGIKKVVGLESNEKGAFLLDETHDAGRLTKINMQDLEANLQSKKGLILNSSFGNCSEMSCDFSIFAKKETLYLEIKSAGEKIEKVKLN